jgi:uncharacterized protein YqgC (DUF456 family)
MVLLALVWLLPVLWFVKLIAVGLMRPSMPALLLLWCGVLLL